LQSQTARLGETVCFLFDDYVIDSARRELRRGCEIVRVEPRSASASLSAPWRQQRLPISSAAVSLFAASAYSTGGLLALCHAVTAGSTARRAAGAILQSPTSQGEE
jgi:hypothetical protein